jgi:hypothetical protein
VEVADRVYFEVLLFDRMYPLEIGQAANAVADNAAVEGRSGQLGNGGLQSVEAVIKRQQCVFADCDDHRFLLDTKHAGARL